MSEINQGGGQPQSLPAVVGNLGVLAAETAPLSHSHVWDDMVGNDPSRLLEVLENDVSTAEMVWEATINGSTSNSINATTKLTFVSCTVTSGALLSSDSEGVCVSKDGLYRQTVTGRIATENGVVGAVSIFTDGSESPIGIWVGSVFSIPTGEVIESTGLNGTVYRHRAFTEADGLAETQLRTSLEAIEMGGHTPLYGSGGRSMMKGYATNSGRGKIDVLPISSSGFGTGTGKVRYIEKITVKKIH